MRTGLNEISRLAPLAPVYAIGFSAGASYLATYMNLEDPERNMIKGCVYISPGYSFREIIKPGKIHSFYNRLLAWAIKRHFRKHHHIIKEFSEDCEQLIEKAETWGEMERTVFYKLHNYSTAEDYIEVHDNAMRSFEACKVPSLTLSAFDDPICVPSLIPFEEFGKSTAAILLTTQKGSHTYWLTTTLWEPFRIRMWCHDLSFSFFDTLRSLHEQ